MRIRKRVTLDEKVYNAAVEYSKLDNRTFSALMQTAVEQMMHRYPKVEIIRDSTRLEKLEIAVNQLLIEIGDLKAAIL